MNIYDQSFNFVVDTTLFLFDQYMNRYYIDLSIKFKCHTAI